MIRQFFFYELTYFTHESNDLISRVLILDEVNNRIKVLLFKNIFFKRVFSLNLKCKDDFSIRLLIGTKSLFQ
ncbi:MAG: hypothetical protein ACJAXI_003571 [Crocinitomicaceae bacterium]|jgi:hypothetical protein